MDKRKDEREKDYSKHTKKWIMARDYTHVQIRISPRECQACEGVT